MKILLINVVCGFGSTGKICTDLYDLLKEKNHECCIAFGRGTAPKGYYTYRIGSKFDNYMHVAKTRLFDAQGFASKKATNDFIQFINAYDPDIIHLHNIHGYYLNIELLFTYLKEKKKRIVWTFHDCWPYTGHCAHYLSNHCFDWKTICNNCKFHYVYPKSLTDHCRRNFIRKKKLFTSIRSLTTIISVSNWLKTEIEQSFFYNFNIETIRSGIDINIFHFRESSLREIMNLVDKKVILGVSSQWNEKKGLQYFMELANSLTKEYQIVLIGLNKNKIRELPLNIIGIEKIEDGKKLAEFYSMADIFCNFSLEETFGLTNYEAQACGTPVLTFDSGGTSETLINDNTYLIEKNINSIIDFIRRFDFSKKKERIDLNKFDKKQAFNEYINLYERIFKYENISNRS